MSERASPPAVRLLPPLAAWAAAWAVLAVGALLGGADPLAPTSWHRWDSEHYLSIAADGYVFSPCAPGSEDFCGNAGWFPLYPLLVAPLLQLGVDPLAAGLIVANAFSLATLVLLWIVGLGGRVTARNAVALAFAALAPGMVYQHAIFPLSVATFFALATLLALGRERWALAGVAGLLTAASYPTGVLVAVVAGGWLLLVRRDVAVAVRLRATALVGALTGAGLLAVLAIQEAQVDRWNAYFVVQSQFDHGLHLPPVQVAGHLAMPLRDPAVAPAPYVQAAAVAALVVALVWIVWRRWRAGRATAFDGLVVLFVLVLWLAPYSQANVTLVRGDALLLPAALLVRTLPLRAGLAAVAVFAAVAVAVTVAFVQGTLV